MRIEPVNWVREWHRARPALLRVCNNRQVHMAIDEVYERLRTGDWWLYSIDGGWLVLEPLHDRIHIVALCSDTLPKGWTLEFTGWLREQMTLLGVSRATLCGRKGWRRALKKLGWIPTDNGEITWVAADH